MQISGLETELKPVSEYFQTYRVLPRLANGQYGILVIELAIFREKKST